MDLTAMNRHRSALWQALIGSPLGRRWGGVMKDRLGVLVSAGPSLSRNAGLLADGTVRSRVLVCATIDAVMPLHQQGVTPDVVVACEPPRQLDLEMVLGLGGTLVAWGDAAEDTRLGGIGVAVPSEAGDGDETFVAHLLLRHLGCDPVVLLGVDLAYVDGIAHAPGHAIDHAWALETNPFRSWDWLHAQRMAQRQGGLLREPDRGGRTVLMDAMLLRERSMLEMAFDEDRRAGLRVIDATEGGCSKRHTDQERLADAIERHAHRRVAALPALEAMPVHRPRITGVQVTHEPPRAVAVVPVDPVHGGTGVARSLESALGDRTVMRRTLERLLASRELERVVVVAPSDWDARPALDGLTVSGRLQFVPWSGTPLAGDPRRRAVARGWSDACWRGGPGPGSVFDEVLAPVALEAAMQMTAANAAFVCGPDWPLVAVRESWGADAMVRRLAHAAEPIGMQFAPGPAGVSGCLLHRSMVNALVRGSVSSLQRWLDARMDWTRRPECMHPPSSVFTLRERVVMDTPRSTLRLRRAVEPLLHGDAEPDLVTLLAAVARQSDAAPTLPPQQLELELNTGRRGCGLASPHRFGSLQRPPMTARRLDRIVARLDECRDTVVTLGGAGDPFIHPDLADLVRRIREAGALSVQVRTELIATDAVEQVSRSGVDVVSVDLHAVDALGYRAMMGPADFGRVEAAVHRLAATHREHGHGSAPLILPRVERLRESVAWVATFLERWSEQGSGAMVDPPPQRDPWGGPLDRAPLAASGDDDWAHRDLVRRITVLSDGRVPAVDGDLLGQSSVGNAELEDLVTLHRLVMSRRRDRRHGAALTMVGAA
jgi:hypothetical protein